jgi:hypothetical protein
MLSRGPVIVDVGNAGIGHLTIDKNEIMQQKVISAIDAVVLGRPKQPFVTPALQTEARR